MSVSNRTGLSIKKRDLQNSKLGATGFKKVVFAHKASAGETGIDLTSLSTPPEYSSVGFVQPSQALLSDLKLKFFRENLTLYSTARGFLHDYLSYTVNSSTQIQFTDSFGTTLEDEIFLGIVDAVPRNGLVGVDSIPILSSGTLSAGSTDFNVGSSFRVNANPNFQIGDIVVYLDGLQQFRNSGNATASVSADGNYEEVDSGDGNGTVIRFNESDSENDRSVLVISTGNKIIRPNGSLMDEIEKLQGQLDKVIETTAVLAGVSESDFQSSPNNIQLKQFGDRVLDLETTSSDHETRITTLENAEPIVSGVNYTTNADFESDISNWFVNTGDGYLQQETTSPLEGDSSLKIVNDFSTTRFVVDGYIDTIDDIDIGVLLGIEATIDTPSTTTDGYYTYELYNNTDGITVSGTSTDLKPGRNYIRGSFVPESGKEYYHRIKDISGANADELVIDRVKITPDRAGTGQPQRIMARYNTSAGQNIPNITATVVDFDTKVYDDGSSSDNVTTGSGWKFTAPRDGKYSVNAAILFENIANWDESDYVELRVDKNGTTTEFYGQRDLGVGTGATSVFYGSSLSGTLEMSEGDYIQIVLTQSRGGGTLLHTDERYNWVSITEVSTPAPINQLDRGVTTSNARALYSYAGSVYTGGSGTSLRFDTTDEDESNGAFEWDDTNHKLIINEAGWYDVNYGYRVYSSSSSWGPVYNRIKKNGTVIKQGENIDPVLLSTNYYFEAPMSTKLKLSAGDELEFVVEWSSGASTENFGTGSTLCYLEVTRIADHSAIAAVGFATSDEADSSARYLLPRYQEATITLTNSGPDNISGSIKCVRIGNQVTITSDGALTHDNVSTPESAAGVIPSDFRPSNDTFNVYFLASSGTYTIEVQADGTIKFFYRNHSGALMSVTSTSVPGLLSYNIT